MDYTIIYVHGFASVGSSSKGILLKKSFPSFKVITPDLSSDPKAAIKQLEEIVQGEKNVAMVGSSLGGFYADYFNVRYDVPTVLVNPLVDAKDLGQFFGKNKNYYTGEEFVFTEEDIAFLEEIQEQKERRPYSGAPECVLLAMDDEVLDYHRALRYFQAENQTVVQFTSGGHRFDNEELVVTSLMALLEDVWDVDFSSPFTEAICKRTALTSLRERFATLLAEPTARTDKIAMWPEIQQLIELSYRDIGGFLGTMDELVADNTIWKLVKRSGKVVAGIIYKAQLGRKGVCGFTDGSAIGKDGLRMIVKEDSRLNRAWIEVSDGLIDGIPYEIPAEFKEECHLATVRHVQFGKHHPEFWDPDQRKTSTKRCIPSRRPPRSFRTSERSSSPSRLP